MLALAVFFRQRLSSLLKALYQRQAWAWQYLAFTMRRGTMSLETGIPMAWVHGVMPAGLALMTLYFAVELLDNCATPLCAGVSLIGLDDPWTGVLDVERAVQGIGSPHAVVVLCHSPDGFPDALRAVAQLPGSPAGIFVCGHTHGGQIAAPWGPIIVPGRVGKKYPHGYHSIPPLHLYVSRGVGATELPMRTWAPPEVAVFELVPA